MPIELSGHDASPTLKVTLNPDTFSGDLRGPDLVFGLGQPLNAGFVIASPLGALGLPTRRLLNYSELNDSTSLDDITLIGQGATTDLTARINPTALAGRHYVLAAEMDSGTAGAGDKVAIYGAAITGSNNSDIWAGNFLAQRASGHSTPDVQGIELDFNEMNGDSVIQPATAASWGLNITSGGTFKPTSAIRIGNTAAGNKWMTGVEIDGSSVNSIAISINDPTSTLTGLLVGKQLSNGDDGVLIQRATDTTPTGYFFRAVNAANSANLALLAVNGDLTIAGILNAQGAAASSFDSLNITNSITFGGDAAISRGAANRLDLASGDSLNLVSGNITLAASNTVDGVDVGAHTHTGAGSNGPQVSHADLSGVTSDQHHAQSHTHASHTSIGTDDHHAQAHTASDHSNILYDQGVGEVVGASVKMGVDNITLANNATSSTLFTTWEFGFVKVIEWDGAAITNTMAPSTTVIKGGTANSGTIQVAVSAGGALTILNNASGGTKRYLIEVVYSTTA